MWWIAWVALTFSNGSVPSADFVSWREGGRHKGRLVGEGGFVTHGISMLCIRGNWGRALGRALHVMLFLENLMRVSLIFNGLQSCHGRRA